jgi:hypothetical protein
MLLGILAGVLEMLVAAATAAFPAATTAAAAAMLFMLLAAAAVTAAVAAAALMLFGLAAATAAAFFLRNCGHADCHRGRARDHQKLAHTHTPLLSKPASEARGSWIQARGGAVNLPGMRASSGVHRVGAGLRVSGADGDHHPPAGLQLVDQRLRHVIRAGRDDDPVERRLLRPAGIAVAGAHGDVAIAELRKLRSPARASGSTISIV